ncbi:MAG: CapA family protein [Rhodospirillales bacterium]|nr:MAG: CapA family protein [Rhodospirillales bacterium]
MPAVDATPQSRAQLTLLLAGDVMTGRGIDQALPHPCDPQLYEDYITSAVDYLRLAEAASGPIPHPVDFSYVWGDALAEIERRQPAVRVINLETAITTSTERQPKGINYRMNPRNVPVLSAARIDCCGLANNHVLDWGVGGLVETLETLAEAGIARTGAGRDAAEATAPAVLQVAEGRVLVYAFGAQSSGVPRSWAATAGRPGVNFLADLGDRQVEAIASAVAAHRTVGDLVVVSLHWGGNWGYEIPRERIAFARGLIDRAGVDIVFGHSAHHRQAIEVHSGKLILYGCGDFLNDYEGIRGYEGYRDDLVLMYLPTVRRADGRLERLTMMPFQIRKFRLARAVPADAAWLSDLLTREGRRFGTRARLDADDSLTLEWA